MTQGTDNVDRGPFVGVAREIAGNQLEQALSFLLEDSETVEDLTGIKILDIGCGSFESPDSLTYDTLTPTLIGPWIVKIAGERGALAIGIDLGPEELIRVR